MKTPLKLYLISQTVNGGWDTYDSAIVAAESAAHARRIHPNGRVTLPLGKTAFTEGAPYWAAGVEHITTKIIGTAKAGTKKGVVLASFNAG